MGTDYTARKLAKKKWKKSGATSDSNGKDRKRKQGAKRRLCQVISLVSGQLKSPSEVMQRPSQRIVALSVQGMCYSEPVLSVEDKVWRDGPSDIEHDSDVKRLQKTHPETHVSIIYACGGWSPFAD